jgi:acetyl-CoA carboxylase biotin carboxyl carrier protein
VVGYFKLGSPALAIGQKVEQGQHVASITALGLANDLESAVGGEVVEVLIRDGDPVEYGQVLARVRA